MGHIVLTEEREVVSHRDRVVNQPEVQMQVIPGSYQAKVQVENQMTPVSSKLIRNFLYLYPVASKLSAVLYGWSG